MPRPARRYAYHARAAVALALAIGCPATAAQTLPGSVQPGRDRPAPDVPSQPDFDFRIEAPHRSPVQRAVDQVHFTLRAIHVNGGTVFPESAFSALYQDLIGKDVTLPDILDVADKIEKLYRDAGYILVRAYVPPQQVDDGEFTINIVEGKIANITVRGGFPATQRRVQSYLDDAVNIAPLPLATMERGLLLANDLPGVVATGVLTPAQDVAGASDVVVDIVQPRFSGGLGVDNRGSRFSGNWTLAGDVQVNSLFGDDQLSGSVTMSPDASKQIAGQLRYRRAIVDDGLIASAFGTITHGQPGSTLKAFEVLTDSWAAGFRLTYPVIRTRRQTLQIDGGFTAQDADVDILGVGLSHDQWRVIDVSVTYLHNNWLGGAWAASVDVAQGLPIFGATESRSPGLSRLGAVTDFTKITGFLRYSALLGARFSAVLTAQGQFAFNPLITGEQIAFGGVNIGRGYDPGGITGDHGIGGSAELRYDVGPPGQAVLNLQPYAFVDGARTWYIQRGAAADPDLINQYIVSVGGGLRGFFPHDITGSVEVATTLNPVAGSDRGRKRTTVFLTAGVRF
ncbi:MAG: ShlB/FhaC/HecB family hemolysin secretion/activation protein [Sphingomonadales bacterium]